MKDEMKVIFVTLLLLVTLGCGGSGNGAATPTPTPTPVPPAPLSYPNLTGNWTITATSTVSAGLTTLVAASLSSVRGSVTGTAHIFNSSCYTVATDIPITGTIDTQRNVMLQSSLVSSQIFIFNGVATPDGSSLASASYSISGGCADGDRGAISAQMMSALSGTYTGTVQSTTGTQIKISAVLNQLGSDPHGYYHESGTASFTGSPCFAESTIANPQTDTLLMSDAFVANFTVNNSTVSVVTVGSFDNAAKNVHLTYAVLGGPCSGDFGSGTLTAP